jgi:hypothetical protein
MVLLESEPKMVNQGRTVVTASVFGTTSSYRHHDNYAAPRSSLLYHLLVILFTNNHFPPFHPTADKTLQPQYILIGWLYYRQISEAAKFKRMLLRASMCFSRERFLLYLAFHACTNKGERADWKL